MTCSSIHNPYAAAAKSLQSCPTLCDRIDSSPPGSSVPGILQARILEWVAILPQPLYASPFQRKRPKFSHVQPGPTQPGTFVTDSKLILLTTQQASKSKDRVLGQGVMALLGEPGV